jgi:hypothetical protein
MTRIDEGKFAHTGFPKAVRMRTSNPGVVGESNEETFVGHSCDEGGFTEA